MTETSRPRARVERHPVSTSGWRFRFLGIVAAALATIVAVDLMVWRVAPPRHLREVEDAIQDLRVMEPTTLVIGSSHARTFAVLADSLRARTGGREELLAVPVEWGKLSSYRWVLEERVLPLLDARGPNGNPRDARLRRAIIVTEWFDSCADTEPARNLPARSWTWAHYLTDLRANGFTDYNGNFLAYRFSRALRWSALVQDRGYGRITSAVRQRVAPSSASALQANYDVQVAMWRGMVENGRDCVGSRSEMDALEWMVSTLEARGISVQVLLYPRMPVTLTAQARASTLPAFVDSVSRRLASYDVPLVDLTVVPVLSDEDFGEDFDHLIRPANAKFSHWLLDGPLASLTMPGR